MSPGPREPAPTARPEPVQPEAPPPPDPEEAWDDFRSPRWEGIPPEVLEHIGGYDVDTAGGCG
jgi:hypothetical protein